MNDTIVHRGPDAEGYWYDSTYGVGLAHRRLAIVDLSEEGRQPMASASGRYILVFNGEIYNFLRIRADLQKLGHRFRGSSDTEVMLAAFEQWGLEASLPRFVGMFAFAVWDAVRGELTLARDRVGKKPLYYAAANGQLILGSEIKALRAFPGFSAPVDRQALAAFLRYGYIPAPYTIYEQVSKLEAAHFARFAIRRTAVVELERQCYWNATQIQAAAAATAAPDRTESGVVEELDRLLHDAVQLRMIADVPLGAFLSGGIDSSLIVALMQSLSSRPVRTFTIGFHESAYNEAPHARAVARHLGTDHTEVFLTPRETLEVIPKLPLMYDEPFADSSQIPTALLCAMARQHVTVALSGDGGDEGFCGYLRYEQARAICARRSRLPAGLLQMMGRSMAHVPITLWERLSILARPIPAVKRRSDGIGYRALRLADRLSCATPQQLYRHLMSNWATPAMLVLGGREPRTVLDEASAKQNVDEFVDQMMLVDTLSYLPDDILVKVDRASMAVALEVRAPLLDHRVLEFAWRQPLAFKLQGGRGKLMLRRVLSRYVPAELWERPKTGFGVPVYDWLRGPLRHWAESLLDEARLRREGYLEPKPIRRLWRTLLAGQSEWAFGGALMWSVLMFQAWLEQVPRDAESESCDSAAPRDFRQALPAAELR